MIYYKIKRLSDGLFSTGGGSPSFTERGKIFNKRNHVTSHLNVVRDKDRIYSDSVVVECEVVEGDFISVKDWKPTKETLRVKQREEQRRLEYECELKLKQIESLEKKIQKLKEHQNA